MMVISVAYEATCSPLVPGKQAISGLVDRKCTTTLSLTNFLPRSRVPCQKGVSVLATLQMNNKTATMRDALLVLCLCLSAVADTVITYRINPENVTEGEATEDPPSQDSASSVRPADVCCTPTLQR